MPREVPMRNTVRLALLLIGTKPAIAAGQMCIGLPIADGTAAVETRYEKVWVGTSLGGVISANLPGMFSVQACSPAV